LIQNTFKTLFNQFMTSKNHPKTHNQSNLNSLHYTRPFDVKLDHFSYRNRRQWQRSLSQMESSDPPLISTEKELKKRENFGMVQKYNI
jgi:hypothetical protein